MAGIARLEHHVGELLAYLERNQGALVHYAARRRIGEPISTAFVESAVNEIIAYARAPRRKRPPKAPQPALTVAIVTTRKRGPKPLVELADDPEVKAFFARIRQ